MIEPAKCPLCDHIPAKTREFIEGPASAFGWSCVCGLACENALSYEPSVANWNTLCEWIRLGKEAIEQAPDGWRTLRVGGGKGGEWIACGMLSRGRTQMETDFACGHVVIEPIPAPVTKEDVLRECAEVIRNGLTQVYENDKEEEMLTKIDTVLSQK